MIRESRAAASWTATRESPSPQIQSSTFAASSCENAAKDINEEGDKLYKAKQYKKAYEVYDKSVRLAELAEDEKLVRKYAKERNKCLEKMN